MAGDGLADKRSATFLADVASSKAARHASVKLHLRGCIPHHTHLPASSLQ